MLAVKRYLYKLIREASDHNDKEMVRKLYRMLQQVHAGETQAVRGDGKKHGSSIRGTE
jgi:hypothetical protein